MTRQIAMSEAGEILEPLLHDATLLGLLLPSDGSLLMPVRTTDGITQYLVLQGVERLRADDFRQGNTILDVTVSSGVSIEVEDVAYAYGLEAKGNSFVTQTVERLRRERCTVVRINPSYGCTLVCVCHGIKVVDHLPPL